MRAGTLFTILTIAACSPPSPATHSPQARSEPSERAHGVVTTIGTNRIADASAAPIVERAADPLVGKPAPRVHGMAHDGSGIDTDDLKGRYVVLYFYPKDETPGCTKEACSFRDAWKDLSRDGAVMIGISADSDESHKKFVAHYKLPFFLLSDTDGSIAAMYQVPVTNGRSARHTIVIAPDGTVKKVYRKVDVSVHAQEVLGDIK